MKQRHPDVIVARERAHAVFDLLWRCGYMDRTAAYAWLRAQFDQTKRDAHIGMLSIEQCARLEQLVADHLKAKEIRRGHEAARQHAKAVLRRAMGRQLAPNFVPSLRAM